MIYLFMVDELFHKKYCTVQCISLAQLIKSVRSINVELVLLAYLIIS